MSDGVPVGDLRCPTCGQAYELPLTVRPLEDDPFVPSDAFTAPTTIVPEPPFVIECPAGHLWTLKTIYRCQGRPDAVILGNFAGGGWR